MKIATHVDAVGRIANLYTPGEVCLYDNASGAWHLVWRTPFHITTDMSLAEVKAALRAVVRGLGDCRTLLSGEVRGLLYSVLQEEGGLRVWKSDGDPVPQLDQIARQDAQLAVQREKEAAEQAFVALFSTPGGGCSGGGDFANLSRKKRSPQALRAILSLTESLGEGRIRIDLSDILTRFKTANSMDVLLPLLEDRPFTSLEILCDHLPRWFGGKIADLDLNAEITKSAKGITALVAPNSWQGRPS